MTLQYIRAASGPARWDDVDAPAALAQTASASQGTLAGMDAWPAANGSCPDDCHYCSGPETD